MELIPTMKAKTIHHNQLNDKELSTLNNLYTITDERI